MEGVSFGSIQTHYNLNATLTWKCVDENENDMYMIWVYGMTWISLDQNENDTLAWICVDENENDTLAWMC